MEDTEMPTKSPQPAALHICEECGAGFPSEKALERHRTNAHGNAAAGEAPADSAEERWSDEGGGTSAAPEPDPTSDRRPAGPADPASTDGGNGPEDAPTPGSAEGDSAAARSSSQKRALDPGVG